MKQELLWVELDLCGRGTQYPSSRNPGALVLGRPSIRLGREATCERGCAGRLLLADYIRSETLTAELILGEPPSDTFVEDHKIEGSECTIAVKKN